MRDLQCQGLNQVRDCQQSKSKAGKLCSSQQNDPMRPTSCCHGMDGCLHKKDRQQTAWLAPLGWKHSVQTFDWSHMSVLDHLQRKSRLTMLLKLNVALRNKLHRYKNPCMKFLRVISARISVHDKWRSQINVHHFHFEN